MAQYQPFVLQVQRMKPHFSTGNGGQNPANGDSTDDDMHKHLLGGETSTPGENKKSKQSKFTGWRIFTGIFCLFALGLFFAVLASPLGHIDKMSNAKSMHLTRNTHAFTFWSLLPSQAYAENMEVQTYRVVDSVLDKKDVNHLEDHGFLIDGTDL